MAEHKYAPISSAPNWAKIMTDNPHLEAPGFQKCLEEARAKKKT
jgi:hypothetical protein